MTNPSSSMPRDRASGTRFVLSAAALMGALYLLYYFPYPAGSWPARALSGFLALQARAAAALIVCFEPGAYAEGAQILGRFPLVIVKACSSLDAQALFAGCVLAFPAPLRAKGLALAAGCALISALNVLRIALLYFVGADAPDAFDSVHEEVMPLLLVVVASAAFAGWAYWLRRGAHLHAAG